jgi:hypothetical protein
MKWHLTVLPYTGMYLGINNNIYNTIYIQGDQIFIHNIIPVNNDLLNKEHPRAISNYITYIKRWGR